MGNDWIKETKERVEREEAAKKQQQEERDRLAQKVRTIARDKAKQFRDTHICEQINAIANSVGEESRLEQKGDSYLCSCLVKHGNRLEVGATICAAGLAAPHFQIEIAGEKKTVMEEQYIGFIELHVVGKRQFREIFPVQKQTFSTDVIDSEGKDWLKEKLVAAYDASLRDPTK